MAFLLTLLGLKLSSSALAISNSLVCKEVGGGARRSDVKWRRVNWSDCPGPSASESARKGSTTSTGPC